MQKTFWVIIGFLLSAGEASATQHTGVTGGGTGVTGGGLTTLPNPLGATTTFQALAAKILAIVSSIGGIIAVFFIIYAGFLFVTAGGNEEKHKDAKKAILYAVIGTAILLGAQALATILETTINSLK
ncbi:MAG: hypothetical protein Q8R17_01190 [bacterium]|nr:hypothetical protein [bacterium]